MKGIEPMFEHITNDPVLIAPALAEILDAIVDTKPTRSPEDSIGAYCQSDVISMTLRELNSTHIEIIDRIAALVTLYRAAINHQTFSEWLGTDSGRRTQAGRELATLMDGDPTWPRERHTYADLRDYIVDHHPICAQTFDQTWARYADEVIAPYGDPDTIRTEIQYATRIAWDDGCDEIHTRTIDGVTRFEAERAARNYNDTTEPSDGATASVVRRAVVYGPWYAV